MLAYTTSQLNDDAVAVRIAREMVIQMLRTRMSVSLFATSNGSLYVASQAQEIGHLCLLNLEHYLLCGDSIEEADKEEGYYEAIAADMQYAASEILKTDGGLDDATR